jgi:hypothetical protein
MMKLLRGREGNSDIRFMSFKKAFCISVLIKNCMGDIME